VHAPHPVHDGVDRAPPARQRVVLGEDDARQHDPQRAAQPAADLHPAAPAATGADLG
jgi:hypothetical protein